MLESVVTGYPDLNLGIHVVWVPMVSGDTEGSAIEMSKMFVDPRVQQYWDPKRLVGTSYSVNVYPSYLRDIEKGMDAALPTDHWWREQERRGKNVGPEKSPLWDVVFTYDNGARWDKTPPVPREMVKQIFFYGEQEEGPSGMFFNDFKKPPRDGDWIVDLATAMTSLVGEAPKTPTAQTLGEKGGKKTGRHALSTPPQPQPPPSPGEHP